ncbi:MAG TPA: glycosyltransferase family 4 protein [Burkholderiales bacterium]
MARLMFVTGSLRYGGAEGHSITLVNRLAERGHECHAVYVKSGAEQLERIRLRDGERVRCLEAVRYFDVAALRRFARHIARVEPAAIVAANPYALMYAALALRLSRHRAALAVTFHSSRLLGLKERLQMLAYRLLFWSADYAVFVCENQRRYWARRAVFARRNEVIYNGVDTEEFKDGLAAGEVARLRAALGLRESDYVIGISAVLRPEKNHVQLVEAIARLRARGIPAKALIIGDGPMRAAVEARARARGVGREVVFCGFQRDVRPFVAACDVMVLCSFTEAFSLAALEAMALGKPVVHAQVGGAAEMIVSGRNGYLFPAGDTGALTGKLALLAERAVSRSMGANARKLVQAQFSVEAMVDRYEQTLMELCRTPSRREAAGAG